MPYERWQSETIAGGEDRGERVRRAISTGRVKKETWKREEWGRTGARKKKEGALPTITKSLKEPLRNKSRGVHFN